MVFIFVGAEFLLKKVLHPCSPHSQSLIKSKLRNCTRKARCTCYNWARLSVIILMWVSFWTQCFPYRHTTQPKCSSNFSGECSRNFFDRRNNTKHNRAVLSFTSAFLSFDVGSLPPIPSTVPIYDWDKNACISSFRHPPTPFHSWLRNCRCTAVLDIKPSWDFPYPLA
jgi:hypothetical protein